jgi:hypothetical protein
MPFRFDLKAFLESRPFETDAEIPIFCVQNRFFRKAAFLPELQVKGVFALSVAFVSPATGDNG